MPSDAVAPDPPARADHRAARAARPAAHAGSPRARAPRPVTPVRGLGLDLARHADAGRAGHAVHRARGAGTRPRARVGPGRPRALASLEALLGFDDDPAALVPRDPVVAEAVRRLRGLRIGRTGPVLEALVPAILEQKVTGAEASRAYRGSSPAGARTPRDRPAGPAPAARPPRCSRALPYHAFHPVGLERRRAELVRAVCPRGAAPGAPRATARRTRRRPRARLRGTAGVPRDRPVDGGRGRRTGRSATRTRSASATSTCPNMVAWALAGEPRGTDERMLELLEPYRGPARPRDPPPGGLGHRGTAPRAAAGPAAHRGHLVSPLALINPEEEPPPMRRVIYSMNVSLTGISPARTGA